MVDALIKNLRAAYARAWVRVKGGNREPLYIAADVLIPVISISAYVFMYRVLGAPARLGGFVILGGTMIAFWGNILWNMSAQFYWEKETGNLEMYFVAPISRMAILLGMAVGGMFNTTLRAIAILILGTYLFQLPLSVGDPLAAFVVFILTLVALYGLGMLTASLFMLYGREAWHTAQLFEQPVQFLSGFFFPFRSLPFALQLAASLIPVTFGLDGIRQVLILGADFSGVVGHILVLALFILVLLPLSKAALGFMENLGKREGRLTLRWQ